jgi:hypothetical protein
MSLKWVVEDYEKDGTLFPLIEEIKSQGMECQVINFLPFQKGSQKFNFDDDCVIFYGSISMSSFFQRKKSWIPGPICNFKNFNCVNYYSHWGEHLFNDDYIMLPILEVSRRRKEIYDRFGKNGIIFIRPNSGAKTFNGSLYSIKDLDSELKMIRDYGSLPIDEILAVISSPKPIDKEWSVTVSTKYGIITSSLYMKDGRLFEERGSPVEVLDLANKIASDPWQPDRIYTVDICESCGEYYFLEINSFSSSGFYKCDPKPIVEIATKIALEEWEEYQEI